MVTIRRATTQDANWMQIGFDTQMGWTKVSGYFASCCDLQEKGELVLLVAVDGDKYVGHLKIIWLPSYVNFRENKIPEIQDLNVLASYRRQGIATMLVDEAEAIIGERSNIAGIGFGLYADYGAAQRMYILRGYVPDGKGLAYHDSYVSPNQVVHVDDDLVLYLIKNL